MTASDGAYVEILPVLYDLVRSIEKESCDVTPKPPETTDFSPKIADLRSKLHHCREQIQKLPGIEYTKQEQLQHIASLREQVVQKRQLLLKYKNMCHFDIPEK